MSGITLIFPDQLFHNHPGVAQDRIIYLVEEFLFFRVQPFHKQRLILLRAAMRAYAKELIEAGMKVVYVPSAELTRRGDLFALLAEKQFKTIHVAEFADDWLYQDLVYAAQKYGWTISFYPSPGFICSNKELKDFFAGKEHYSMAQFYAYQRKRLNILMEGSKPVGGKYSFDVENRKKIPKNLTIPAAFIANHDPNLDLLIDEIEHEFPDAIGNAHPFLYPSTRNEVNRALTVFLEQKLARFGEYQDAIQKENSMLFHSVLSPLLNTGLITPLEVVNATLSYAEKNSIPLNSLEGFLRQIIGWREFVRASYLLYGSAQRSVNFFNHHHKIPKSFWKGTTGILPVDTIIHNILRTGYCNHIERLMVLGNFLLLTESSPHDVYRWFMGYFIDAYDWVMVPNIYGMSQYADGGKIVTKPYISGSNYLLKMSDYPKGGWTEIWDGLFWRFLHMHRLVFAANPRTFTLMQLLNKNESTILPKIRKADNWLNEYRANGKDHF
jgi:deoxyribodipyrimidine photolyase-related protein